MADKNTGSSCYLCGRDMMTSMVKYSSCTSEIKRFIERHLNDVPPESAKLCKRDLLEAKRHSSDMSYTPKWKETQIIKEVNHCVYPGCTETSANAKISRATFASRESLMALVGLHTNTTVEVPTFCKAHYSSLYEIVNPRKCASCDAYPKGTFKYRSPNAQLVSAYFKEANISSKEVTSDDLLCKNCYKLHISLIENSPEVFNNNLKSDIALWSKSKNEKSSSKLTASILESVIFVANHIICEKALLLTD
jgi:hypothetical protein